MNKKKILIISPFFAPENSIASVRFTKIGKYFVRKGYIVDVICSDMQDHYHVDKTLEKDMHYFRNIFRIRYPELYYYYLRKSGGKQTTAGTGISRKSQFEKRVEGMMSYAFHLLNFFMGMKYIRVLKHHQLLNEYDSVISTYSPTASHFAGQYLKKKGYCRVWIADYRDVFLQFSNSLYYTRRMSKDNLDFEIQADYVTTVSEGCRKSIVEQGKKNGIDLSRKVRVISNGFDPEDEGTDAPRVQKWLQVCYCGTFYSFSDYYCTYPYVLFQTIKELKEEGILEKSKFKFCYAGTSGNIVDSLAKEYGIEEFVENYGIVPREKSISLQSESDIILLSVWNTKEKPGCISGKFYETLLVKKNVLALVSGDEEDSELGHMIKQYGLGYCQEKAGKKGSGKVKEWLKEKYLEKQEKGCIQYYAVRNVEKFQHEKLAESFISLMDGKDGKEE